MHRANAEHEAAISQAWHTAAFHRVKKFPALDKVLRRKPGKPKRARKARPWQKQLAAWERALGGKRSG